MVSTKSNRELELMRYAGSVVATVLEKMNDHIKPGVSTLYLDKLAEQWIVEAGCTPSFKGYGGFPGSICASVNEVLVHGIPSIDILLKEGDVITIDVGAEFKGYHADSAWTYAVGAISEETEKLLQVTHDSLFEGLKSAKAGNYLGDISHAIGSYIKPYGFGIPMDFTGHGIGRNLHEDPAIFNDGIPGRGILLKEGMTLCIEPMVQLGTDQTTIDPIDKWTVRSKDHSLTAHYEHTIVITQDGYEILTKTNEKEESNG